MFQKKLHWHLLAESPEALFWQDNGIAIANVNGKKICIARYREQYHIAYTCDASDLASGGSTCQNVFAPHRYKFNITNGRNTSKDIIKTYLMCRRKCIC
jgi:3-phenylpropionate/trans-cinnamate dioxygenase ferredoxin subunit